MTIAPATTMAPLLAQTTVQQSGDILWWLGAILGSVVLILVVGIFVRRRYQAGLDDSAAGVASFTLGDLRDMHKKGHLTDEEFETAKRSLIARSRAAMDRGATGPTDPNPLADAGFDDVVDADEIEDEPPSPPSRS